MNLLSKWRVHRPTRFNDYAALPSRYDLISLFMGKYNLCWSFDEVANAVAKQYAGVSDNLRGEMITSSLIAHRRNRMLNGYDGFDLNDIFADIDCFIMNGGKWKYRNGETTFTAYKPCPAMWHPHYWDSERQVALPSGPPVFIPDPWEQGNN